MTSADNRIDDLLERVKMLEKALREIAQRLASVESAWKEKR